MTDWEKIEELADLDWEEIEKYIEPSDLEMWDPHGVMESDREDYSKIYRLAHILVRNVKEGDRDAACGYLMDMIGESGGLMLAAIILHYEETCPDIPFPVVADLTQQLEKLFPDKPDQT